MRDAIINLINALAEKIKPHQHDWELIDTALWEDRLNPKHKWTQWTYRCKKCGEGRKIDNN